MTPAAALLAIRELVEAAEAAGWDTTENKDVLQRGRDAYASLRDTFEELSAIQRRIVT